MNNSLDNLRSTEEEWKQLLNGNFRNITEIVKPDEIASWLRQEKVINNFDYEDVTKHINNSRTNCGKLIDIILRRGVDGIKKFLTVLSYEYPELFYKITNRSPLDIPSDYTPHRLSSYMHQTSVRSALIEAQRANRDLIKTLQQKFDTIVLRQTFGENNSLEQQFYEFKEKYQVLSNRYKQLETELLDSRNEIKYLISQKEYYEDRFKRLADLYRGETVDEIRKNLRN